MHFSFSDLPDTAQIYLQYLDRLGIRCSTEAQAQLYQILQQTPWDEPQTALDFNNVAVIALIEAEQADTPDLRSLYFETALEALDAAQNDHPLCAPQFAIAQSLIGNSAEARQIAFSTVISQAATPQSSLPGLVYLPTAFEQHYHLLGHILESHTGQQQAQRLGAAALLQSNPIFYNALGQRFLAIADRLFPNTPKLHLQQGIARLMNGQWEGILDLQQADALQPQQTDVLHSLWLAYRTLGETPIAEHYRQQGQQINAAWAKLPPDSPVTQCFFDGVDLILEASFQSLVTGVLLGLGDWFEAEMEFWRNYLQPGMTVIDVGANVGLYTFSAAQRVGSLGQVFAIEPFSKCVAALEQTRDLNHLPQVQICRGAASDHNGTLKLALQGSSELNEVYAEDAALPEGSYEAVPCFTLDSLVSQHPVSRVDVLKIDAEGHELQVLQGCDRILRQFKPTILYENIAGSKGSNLTVAQFLQDHDYQLCRYQPFLGQLIAIADLETLDDCLNVIAIPVSSVS